ncbi:hypothetical protein Y045_4603 [Burkholderia pseudomallei MSHR2451]|nr:hypothetical protein DO70_1474 [Burkholderia pseudomallei]KGS46797.1 hypothetical protein X992_2952 [Burkholderia pseudomallei MSHR5492]KGW33836.1 hypothetical protein Y045_4603 [Burkholderia pseudomallei MSHR2451]
MQSRRAPPPAPPRRNPHTMPNNPGTRQPFVRGKAAATPDRSVDWPGFECPAAACKPKRVRFGRAATRRRDARAYAQAARETPPVRGMGALRASGDAAVAMQAIAWADFAPLRRPACMRPLHSQSYELHAPLFIFLCIPR